MTRWKESHELFLASENHSRLTELHWPQRSQLTDQLRFIKVPLAVPFGSDPPSHDMKVLRPHCASCGFTFWKDNSATSFETHVKSASHYKMQISMNHPRSDTSDQQHWTFTRSHLQEQAKLKSAGLFGRVDRSSEKDTTWPDPWCVSKNNQETKEIDNSAVGLWN